MAFLIVALVIFMVRRFLLSLLPYLIAIANLLVFFSKIVDQVSSCNLWQKQIWLHFVTNNEASATPTWDTNLEGLVMFHALCS